MSKETEYALIIDDTLDIGKEPLPIDDEKIQELMKKHIKEINDELKAP